MNNFEKFKNKEIDDNAHSEVMGGSSGFVCVGGDVPWCVFAEFITMSQSCHWDPDWTATEVFLCQTAFCALAHEFCEVQ